MNRSISLFICLRCGKCCKASPISLLPHEVLVMKKYAKEYGLTLEFNEGYSVYDRISNYNIVLTYHMQLSRDNKCPFLTSNNKCLVHNSYKPLICRSFPYTIKTINYYFDPLSKTAFHKSVYAISLACSFVKSHANVIEPYLNNEVFVRKIFTEELKYANLMERYRSMYLLALSFLWRMKYIDLLSESKRNKLSINAYLFIRQYIPYFAIRPY